MFSLIITIISVALVTALALATLYFGGETYRDAQLRATAAAAINQGQQLLAASELFYLHKRAWPTGVAELQSEGYLNSTPSMPGAMAAGGLITPALANAQPWAEVAPGAPHFWVRQKVGAELCREINWQARGDDGIYTRALPLLETQCYGTAEPFTVLVHKTDRAVAAAEGGAGASPSLEETVGVVAPGETTGNVTPGDLAGKTAPDTLGGGWAVAPDIMLCKIPVTETWSGWQVRSNRGHSRALYRENVIFNGFEFVPCGIEGSTGPSGVAPELADDSGGDAGPLAFALSAQDPPDAMLGVPYAFDFVSFLTMTGAPQPALGDITWSLAAGTLPAGLSLSEDGQLTGTPSEMTGAGGAEVTVLAWHTDASGQQVYTIRVGEALLQVTSISTGNMHACAITTTGGVKCWGTTWQGRVGDGTEDDDRLSPVDVVGLTSGVVSVSAGTDHSCAVTAAGGVKCWGRNGYGQLGDGTTTTRLAPVDVVGLTSGAVSVDVGKGHSCAVTTAGGVKCWGWNDEGQLGDGTNEGRLTPVDVVGLTGVASIATGYSHTCALTTAGGVKCWGDDEGLIGDGVYEARPTPTDVVGLSSGVASIAAGFFHTCAVTTSGELKCWGWNGYGQLGDGTYEDRPAPVDVGGLPAVASVTAGDDYTCVVTTAGGAKCWGTNYEGQLGDGTYEDRLAPVDVVGLTSGVASLSAGEGFICARLDTGSAKCWGANDYGQRGNGTYDYELPPTNVIP